MDSGTGVVVVRCTVLRADLDRVVVQREEQGAQRGDQEARSQNRERRRSEGRSADGDLRILLFEAGDAAVRVLGRQRDGGQDGRLPSGRSAGGCG